MDPFFGAGTTGMVAQQNGRRYLGIELNPAYVDIAKKRIGHLDEDLAALIDGVDEEDLVG